MKDIYKIGREDYKAVPEQLKYEWMITVLAQCGLDLSECVPDSGNFAEWTIPQKMKFRGILNVNNILITEDNNSNTLIYIQGQEVARWNKPRFKIVANLSEVDPHKKSHYEMEVDFTMIKESND